MSTLEPTRIREIVCHAISLTLQRSGRQIPVFRDNDMPVTSYEGFDSQCGVEVTLELEELLGIEDLGTNIFVKGVGSAARARTLSEIVNCVLQLADGAKA